MSTIFESPKPRLSQLRIRTQLNLNLTSDTKLVLHEINQALYYARKLRLKMRRRIASRLTFNYLFIIIKMEYLFCYLVLGSFLLCRCIFVNILAYVYIFLSFAVLYVYIYFHVFYSLFFVYPDV